MGFPREHEPNGECPKPEIRRLVGGFRVRVIQGFVLGFLIGMALWHVGVLELDGYAELVVGFIGAVVAITCVRFLLWIVVTALVTCLLVLAYTPLVWMLSRGLTRQDTLQNAPAVVVLGSSAFEDRTLSAREQQRVIHGYALLAQGYAPRLVLTRPLPPVAPWGDTVRRQMADLHLDFPVDVVGPGSNTHDEATFVAALARQQHWNRVILVTDPWHIKRAAAAFEKAGLSVVCSPCAETQFDWNRLQDPHDRIRCFQFWLHEMVGYQVYRLRGWV